MKIRSLFISVATAITTAVALTTSIAAPVGAAPSTSLNVELGPGVEIGTTVNLAQTEVQSVSLPYLRQVRADMYDRNVPFNGRSLREAVASKGLTRDDYVNGLQWSGDMERIAVQRAVEEKYSGRITHDRANDTSPFTAFVPGGSRSYAENLCQGHATVEACLKSLTYGEERYLRRSNGISNNDSGHLYNVLNPSNSHVGVGAVDRFYVTHHSSAPSSTQPLSDGYTPLSLAVPEEDITRHFSLTPSRSRLAPGESTDVIMHNGQGFDLPGTLESSDNSIATAVGTTVTALDLGKTTIRFLSDHEYFSDSTSITVAERAAASGPDSSSGSSADSNPLLVIIAVILATVGISAGLLGLDALP